MDGLRGCAIILVVLFHVFVKTHFAFGVTLGWFHIDARNTVQAGFLGVSIFFFVSGFCLMLPYATALVEKQSAPTWGEYASRRFWKIVPSYYLALGTMLVLPIDHRAQLPIFVDGASHALFLNAFDGETFTSLNSNFWSLAVEVEFYLLFPLLVFGFARAPLVATATTIVLGLGYSIEIARLGLDKFFIWSYQLPSCLPLFACGAITAWAYARFIRGREISADVRTQCALVAIAGIVLIEYLFDQVNRSGGGSFAWAWENGHRFELGITLAIFSLAVCAAPQRAQRLFANPLLMFFSDISYNMYLWNAVMIAIVASHYRGDDSWHGGLFMLAVVGGTTAIGYVLTMYFERPLIRWNVRRNNLRQRAPESA